MPFQINKDGRLTDVPSLPLQQQTSMPQFSGQGMGAMPSPGLPPQPPTGMPPPQAAPAFTGGPPPVPKDPDSRADLWRNLLADFTWSLGSSMTAGANAPPGQRNQAAFGAALQAPYQRRQTEAAASAKQALEAAQSQAQLSQVQRVTDENRHQIQLEELKRQADAEKRQSFLDNLPGQQAIIALKNAQTDRAKAQTGAIGQQETDTLRKRFLKKDASGATVPLEDSELSPFERAIRDHQDAQTELAKAAAAWDKVKADPNNPEYQLKRDMLDVAKRNVDLRGKEFEANFKGTIGGAPISGGPVDKSGNPVGIRVQGLTGPTVTTRNKAQQADVVLKEGGRLLDEIDNFKDELGPVPGRLTTIERGIGSDNEKQATLYTHLKSFAALQPALHGARGVQYQKEFEDAIGNTVQNPEALKASIRSLMGTAGSFQDEGTNTAKPVAPVKPAAGGFVIKNGKAVRAGATP